MRIMGVGGAGVTRNIVAAARCAGVKHHIVLSIIGVGHLSEPSRVEERSLEDAR